MRLVKPQEKSKDMKLDVKKPSREQLVSIDLHELLPQQEPFVMVDRLIGFGETETETETEIKADNIFVDGGVFSASGLIENIAQTCAVRIGYVNRYIYNKGIQLGFIGAIRNLEITGLPKVGDTIITRVNVLEDVFGMTLASAEVTCAGNTLVTTEIKIAIKEGEEK